MNTVDTKPLPCQCLRTKNPYGSTPTDGGVMASRSAHGFELLVPAHHEPRGA